MFRAWGVRANTPHPSYNTNGSLTETFSVALKVSVSFATTPARFSGSDYQLGVAGRVRFRFLCFLNITPFADTSYEEAARFFPLNLIQLRYIYTYI